MYYYGARWYDPALGRFVQPDTIVPNPGDAKSFDRYAYVLNNPLRYSDPTGHCEQTIGDDDYECLNLAQTIYRKYPGMFSRDDLERTQFTYLQQTYAELQANPPKPTTSSVLLQTAESLSNVALPVEVSFAHGFPTVSFDHNKFTEAVSSLLKACASAIGGACGAAYNLSENAAGVGVRGDFAVYADQNGNVGVFGEFGGGAYTPWPGPLSKVSITGIPGAGIQDLDGMFAQLGVSGAAGWLGGGGEAVFGRADSGRILRGQTYSEAQGAGAEGHFTFTWGHPVLLIDADK